MTVSANNIALSDAPIPVEERLIVALDCPDNEMAKRWVHELGDSVSFYKVGLELFMGGAYFEMLGWLADQGKKVFVDLKFFDVPQTVKSAVKQLKKYHVAFATVHGNDGILRAAVEEKGDTKILAVTVLTSLDEADQRDLGFRVPIKDVVLSRARRALALGCDGVVSSGLEASELRSELGERLLIVVPGIRPGGNTDDQKRTVDVEEAFRKGGDYIVVGRPIRNPPDGMTPRQVAEDVQARIGQIFGK